jgi:hypothetical protein
MLINKDYLLQTVLEESDLFRVHFSDLTEEIDKYVAKPKCNICVTFLIKKILLDAKHIHKLMIIFDDPDIRLAQDILELAYHSEQKTARRTKSKVEVFYVPVADAKSFIESYTEDKIIRSIDTILIPKHAPSVSQIMVTLHWSSL